MATPDGATEPLRRRHPLSPWAHRGPRPDLPLSWAAFGCGACLQAVCWDRSYTQPPPPGTRQNPSNKPESGPLRVRAGMGAAKEGRRDNWVLVPFTLEPKPEALGGAGFTMAQPCLTACGIPPGRDLNPREVCKTKPDCRKESSVLTLVFDIPCLFLVHVMSRVAKPLHFFQAAFPQPRAEVLLQAAHKGPCPHPVPWYPCDKGPSMEKERHWSFRKTLSGSRDRSKQQD